jgi:hypothetical protein
MAVSYHGLAPPGIGGPSRIAGRLGASRVHYHVQIERYLLIEAARLEILAEVAAAKGHHDLAEDIRHCRRVLIDAVPLKRAADVDADQAARDGKVRDFSL